MTAKTSSDVPRKRDEINDHPREQSRRQNSAYRHPNMKGVFGNEGALRFCLRKLSSIDRTESLCCASCLGYRTRLACLRSRFGFANFFCLSRLQGKSVSARTPQPARETRALPKTVLITRVETP